MSRSSSNLKTSEKGLVLKPRRPNLRRSLIFAIGLPAWVLASFFIAQATALSGIYGVQAAGVALDKVNVSVFSVIASVVVYTLTLLIVIGLPLAVRKSRTTKQDLGLQRLPVWMDLIWAPTGAFVYAILTFVVTAIGMLVLTFVDFNQTQQTGFNDATSQLDLLLAFLGLVVIAPVAEEVLFRGYLFGKLRKHVKLWIAILLTSLLFALVHFQWNVSLDTFALSIVLCLLRVVSGSLWPSIMLHMLKNGIAFYFLFINPTALSTLM